MMHISRCLFIIFACLAVLAVAPAAIQAQEDAGEVAGAVDVYAGPGAFEVAAPQVSTRSSAQASCRSGQSHILSVEWTVTGMEEEVTLGVVALLPDGTEERYRGSGAEGRAQVSFDAPQGGHATIVVRARSAAGQTATAHDSTILTDCSPVPRPAPGTGFDEAIESLPPAEVFPNETDIAHVRGTPEFGQPIVVAAVGAGGSAKLLSYTLQPNETDPVLLATTPQIIGNDVKLHTLKPIGGAGAINPVLIAAVRRSGNLWLTSWRAEDDGTLTALDTLGYGANADVRVQAYAIAHAEGSGDDRTLVATPVRTQNNQLRVVTWSVSPEGDIAGLHDSGDWGDPAPDTELTIAYQRGLGFVVGYENPEGILSTNVWSVGPGGLPDQIGGGTSGLDIRAGVAVSESISHVVALPLNEGGGGEVGGLGGFVTAVLPHSPEAGSVGVDMHVWEQRVVNCTLGCWSVPHAIADNSLDQSPNSLGVEISPAPSPTDGFASATSTTEPVRALLTDGLIETDIGGGVGAGMLFQQPPPAGELTSAHLASVTKNMTLLLAAEAIAAGEKALSDEVEVSVAAAAVGGSNMGLEAIEGETPAEDQGERQSFETLLHGMMIVSGNDAAAAVAEHVAGSTDAFINLMNERANSDDPSADDLGLPNTRFGQATGANGGPAGGGISTTQEQVTFWLAARENPIFRRIARANSYYGCGIDPTGEEKCYDIVKGGGNYPSLNGWKGGSGGWTVPNFAGPFCTDGGCVVAEALRLGRPMIVALLNTGDRWNDVYDLFDHGYQLQYTPDHRRGSGNQGGQARDIGLDVVSDTVTVTAQIEDKTLRICQWQVEAGTALVDRIGCHTPDVGELAAGPMAAPTVLDAQRLPPVLFEGDYVTGHIEGGQLELNAWRFGPLVP